MRSSSWDRESRSQLEDIMAQGYSVMQASEKVGKSYRTTLTEIKRGCTEDEYSEKRFSQYKANRATLVELFEGVPEEEIRRVLKELQAEARKL